MFVFVYMVVFLASIGKEISAIKKAIRANILLVFPNMKYGIETFLLHTNYGSLLVKNNGV